MVERKTDELPVFNFEGKGNDVLDISYNTISKSINRSAGLAGIRNIPVQFWKFYSLVSSIIDNHDINSVKTPMHVQWNSSKAYLTDLDKEKGYTQKNAPIDRWRFDKVISMINLPNIVSGENGMSRNASIGLTLNKEGLSVAFGMNVHECSNFNVMGGTVMRSYGLRGNEGTPWDAMKFRLEKWISELNQLWTVQNEIVDAFTAHSLPVDLPVVEEVVGDLYLGAIKQSYFKGDAVPFNTHELSNFAQETIKQKKEEDSISNLWDLYNWGTSIMKPGQFDIGEIANNSNMWADYLIDRFALDVPKNILQIEE
jgi:hypothetical protein